MELIDATSISTVTYFAYSGTPPLSAGSTFSVKAEGRSYEIVNMCHENFEDLFKKGVLKWPVKIAVLEGQKHAVLVGDFPPGYQYEDPRKSGCPKELLKPVRLLSVKGEETFLYSNYLIDPPIQATDLHKAALKALYVEEMFRARPDWLDRMSQSSFEKLITAWEENPPHDIDIRDFSSTQFALDRYNRYKEWINSACPTDSFQRFDGFPYMPVMAGRAGEVIMRGDRVFSAFITRMS